MGLKRRQRVEPEFSLAAMIDVIFLLLMFFMLTSNFVTPNALNLQLPSSTSKSMASPSLSVSVKADGTFYIDRLGVDKTKLEAALRSRIKADNKDPKATTITVAADKAATVESVVFILDIANRLKVKTILATNPDQGGNQNQGQGGGHKIQLSAQPPCPFFSQKKHPDDCPHPAGIQPFFYPGSHQGNSAIC